jgi:hypothetical protein
MQRVPTSDPPRESAASAPMLKFAAGPRIPAAQPAAPLRTQRGYLWTLRSRAPKRISSSNALRNRAPNAGLETCLRRWIGHPLPDEPDFRPYIGSGAEPFAEPAPPQSTNVRDTARKPSPLPRLNALNGGTDPEIGAENAIKYSHSRYLSSCFRGRSDLEKQRAEAVGQAAQASSPRVCADTDLPNWQVHRPPRLLRFILPRFLIS